MSGKPDLLLTQPLMPLAMDSLAAAFTLHSLWDIASEPVLLAKLAPHCRFMATGPRRDVDEALMSQLPALEIIGNFGVGYDTIDAKAAAMRGVIVTNTPDVLTDEVADLAMGLLIATIRELPQADRYLRTRQWEKAPYPLTRGTLRGRHIGILGLGRIGRAIAKRAEAFDLKISYHARHKQAGIHYRYFKSLEDMAQAVDILMVVAPGGPETNKIVDASILEKLGQNGVLINVARGTLIDETALIKALQSGAILSAGLDVFADEPLVPEALVALSHVVLLPHIGSASQHTRERMAKLLVDNLLSWKDGRGPITPVAETPWKR